MSGAEAPRSHGMTGDLVAATWAAITDAEARSILERYAESVGADIRRSSVLWRSPRPMSAAAIVSLGTGRVFLKRHDASVRDPGQLAAEHAFVAHLRARGQRIPEVLRLDGTATTVRREAAVYEAHAEAAGTDLYRDVPSWHPYRSLAHARHSGRALARFHAAARDFPGPERTFSALVGTLEIVSASDSALALERLLERRPALARSLAGRTPADDLVRYHHDRIRRVGPALRSLPAQWMHGDWHPSNLTWTSPRTDARVATTLDVGLANRGVAIHDLAVALERATIDWLALGRTGRAEADLDAMDALIDGYEQVRPLTGTEAMLLPDLLPLAHLEYALSEVEYFGAVVGSTKDVALAYEGYFLGHSEWFESRNGAAVVEHLRRRAATHTDGSRAR